MRGREAARDYDLERPRYNIEIVKGDRVVAREETDRELLFDGTMSLEFSSSADWVFVEAVYDPFLPMFLSGLGLLIAGAILYPLSIINYRL